MNLGRPTELTSRSECNEVISAALVFAEILWGIDPTIIIIKGNL
jgi:hypothetical protein